MVTATLAPQSPESATVAQIRFRQHLSDIAQQSSVSFAGTVFTLVLGYAFRVYLARELGARLLGWNALGMGVYGLCKIIGEMGLPAAALRYMASYSAKAQRSELSHFFWRALSWSMGGTALLCAVVLAERNWIAGHFFHDAALARYLPLYALLIPVGAASSFLTHTLSGLKLVSRSTVITKFVAFPFMIVATIAALVMGLSLWGYVAAQIAGEALTLILAIACLWRSSVMHPHLTDVPGRRLQPEVRWFAASMLGMAVLGFVAGRADRLVLGYFLPAKQVGIYAVATSAAALCALVLQAVNSIFAPTIASLHTAGEHTLLSGLYQTLTKWIIALTFPLIMLFVIFSRQLMGLFGADFLGGSAILSVVAMAELVNCGTGSVGYLLLMSGNEKRLIRVQLAVAILVLGLNLALIPLWGILGAAVVSAASTVMINTACLTVVRRRLNLYPYNRSYLKLACPGIVCVAALLLLRHNASYWRSEAILPLAFVLAYGLFLVSFLMFGLDDDDRLIVQLARERFAGLLSPKAGL